MGRGYRVCLPSEEELCTYQKKNGYSHKLTILNNNYLIPTKIEKLKMLRGIVQVVGQHYLNHSTPL